MIVNELNNFSNNIKKKSIIGLMGVLLINNILYMFINTFMIAYFFTLTNYDYKIISLFYIMSFVFIAISSLILGPIIKSKMQVPIFRLGIILYCIYVLLIALLKENILNYYIWLGIFYGIVQGVLWSAGHILVNEYANDISNKFVSIKSMISDILKIIFPFIFGTSIELTSFSNVAKMVLILSVTQFSFSLLIKEKNIKKTKYNLRNFIEYLKEIKSIKMKFFYKIMFYEGIVNYLLKTLITIMIVMTFKTNISLGILTTIFSFCSIASVFIFQKKLKNNNKILTISTIMIILSVTLLLFKIDKTTVIIYNLINSVFLILLINNAEEKRYSIINNDKLIFQNYLAEHQVVSEISLNISRIIGYIILFMISYFNNIIYFKILLVLVTIAIIYYASLMMKLNNTI